MISKQKWFEGFQKQFDFCLATAMGFLKKRVTPLELLTHIVDMSNMIRPGITKILDGIARQFNISENEMHEESIFAIELLC